MAYSTPFTASAGVVLTSAVWNASVRDDILFLAAVTGVQATHNAAQSLAHATITDIAFNTHVNGPVGDAGVHSTSTNNPRFIATRTGWWRLEATLAFAANATGVRMVEVFHSTLTVPIAQTLVPASGAGNLTVVSVGMTGYYTATAYAKVRGYQDSGGALNVASTTYYTPAASWVWMGA